MSLLPLLMGVGFHMAAGWAESTAFASSPKTRPLEGYGYLPQEQELGVGKRFWNRTNEAREQAQIAMARDKVRRDIVGGGYKSFIKGTFKEGGSLSAGWNNLMTRTEKIMNKAGILGQDISPQRMLGTMAAGSAVRLLNTFYLTSFAADTIVGVTTSVVNNMIELGKPREMRPNYYDTPAAATMRQAAVMAIHQNRMNTLSSIGREAFHFHQ